MSELERFQSDQKLNTPINREWVKNYSQGRSVYPITMEIDPTNKCPLDCQYCIWKDMRYEAKDSLRPQDLLRVVHEAKDIGVRSLIWTGGGEPLAHPTTLSAIQTSRSLGMKNALFTTGVPLTPRVTESLVDNLEWVRFHVDGATPESYGSTHNVNGIVFNKVVANIEYFNMRRRETGSKVTAGMNTVALETDVGEVQMLARLAREMGLDFFQFKHDLTRTYDLDYHQWWESAAVPVLEELDRDLGSKDFKIQFVKKINISALDISRSCHIHHALTAITADGRVSYCKNTRDRQEWSLGSIYENSLREIFDSPKHRQLKELVTPETCGVLPCPNKAANLALEGVVNTQSLDFLGPVNSVVENQDFI